MKKFISILLAISIVLTTLIVLPLSASAADLTEGDYRYTVSNNKATITDYTGKGGAITIPSTLGGYPVTRIGGSAFNSCYSLTSVTIPDSVTSIGYNAFYYCTGLTSVTIGNSVTSIEHDAFFYCSRLADVYYVGSKDGWNKISIGSYNSYLTNAKRHYMCRITVYNNDGSVKERVLVSRDASYELPYDEISGYTFFGYYTEKMGERTQITDNRGKSLEPFNFQNDINAYPFYFKPNTAAIFGAQKCEIGSPFTKSVEFATDKDDVEYAIFDIKYPKNLSLKEITPKGFKYVTKDNEKDEGDYKILTLICQYSDGECVPKNKAIKPFELSFTVNQDSAVGDFDISILDTSIMIGGSDYPFAEIQNDKIKVTPKLAESVSVSGDSTISEYGEYTATVLPDYTTDKSVTWSVDNEAVATIDQSGKLTAHKNGTVKVKATAVGGAYGTKSVAVKCPIKLDSLTSDIGVWDKEFAPTTYEYKISVPEECDSITITPSFTGGTLKYNGSMWINNREKEISLTDAETTVVLNRSGVEGMTDSTYTLTIKKEKNIVIVPVKGVSLDKTELTMGINKTYKLNARIMPDNATKKGVTWKSSNNNVATVENGLVTAKDKGEATITVTTKDGGYTASCKVKVIVSASGVSLDKTALAMDINKTYKLNATVTPDNATEKGVTWKSSNNNVATVENGLVTAKGKGEATITATTIDGGYTASCKVIVSVPVSGVSLDKTELTMGINKTYKLNATVTPDNANEKGVTWRSANNNVATVENGLVTAKGKGKATITVITNDGEYRATCKVTVVGPEIEIKSYNTTDGKTIEVPVSVKYNPGIYSISATVTFDNTNLKLKDVKNGDVFGDGAFKKSSTDTDEYALNFINTTKTDVDKDGNLAILVFEIEKGTELGSYPITISWGDNGIKNSKNESLEVDAKNGEINVVDVIPGDVNGDGSVDDMDWTIIFNHVSYIIEYDGLPSWDEPTEYDPSVFAAADVNNDGNVDDMDWTIIFNHVSYIIENENLPKW